MQKITNKLRLRRETKSMCNVRGFLSSHVCITVLFITMLILTGVYFAQYSLTHADNVATLNINNGEVMLNNVPKNGTAVAFSLMTRTTTANGFGYTLSVYNTSSTNKIVISKDDGTGDCSTATVISSDKDVPTDIEITNAPNTSGLNTTWTLYCASVASDITDGTHFVTITYHLSENQTAPPFTPTTFAEFTADYCSNEMVLDDIITLIDERDDQEYRVRKMADSKCWMIDNLKYSYGIVMSDDYSYTPDYYDYPHFWDPPSVWNGDVSYCDPYASNNVFTENPESKTGCGYLYNWAAATEGTGVSSTIGDATSSICPINFRLPRGGNVKNVNNDFDQLNATMAGYTSNQDSGYTTSNYYTYYTNWSPTGPWQGVFADFYGGMPGGGIHNASRGAYYWSSTAYDTYNVSGLELYSSFNPNYSLYKINGYAIRCLM
jgi:uncharacterized protein (TIGR02145 family)